VLRAVAVAVPEEAGIAGFVGETEGVDCVVGLVEGCVEAEGLWGLGVAVGGGGGWGDELLDGVGDGCGDWAG
jgi:hypothetical protein